MTENNVRAVLQNAHRVSFCQKPAMEPSAGTILLQEAEIAHLANKNIDAMQVEGECRGRRRPPRARHKSDLRSSQT